MADTHSVEGGLWGAIVIFSAFFIQVVAFGTSQAIGVYNIEFLRTFDTGAAAVSLVGSINLGIFLGAGPVCSVLMAKWSHRQVALLGAALSNLGLICMPFAPNLPYMYAFYGVLAGLGYSLVYVPSHILSGLYYSKYRSLSTGVATAGSGMGSTVFPMIIYNLIQYYGWRGSLLILAGLNLHLFVFAALLRPVPRALLKAYELQEKNAESEKLVNETYDEARSQSRIKYENNDEDISYKLISSKEEEAVSADKLIVRNPEEFDSDKVVNNCVNSNEVREDHGGQDNTSSPVCPNSVSQTDLIRSNYRKLLSHFKMVFTFEFLIFWLSNIGWNAGGGIALIFLPKYMTSVGLTEENASIAFSAFGAGSCVGCVVGGLLGNIRCCNRIIVYILGNIGAGVFTLLISVQYFHSFVGFMFLTSVFGLMFGIILGLLVVVTSDLLGTEALGYGFGYLMLANGVGIFCGPPFAGVLIDSLGELNPAIYLSGCCTIYGGVVMTIVPICRAWRGTATKRPMKEMTLTVIPDLHC